MKKLLTLAVVVATIGLAQAATLNWSAMQIYQPKKNPTDANVAVNGGLALLFITEQSGDFGAGLTTIDDVVAFITGGATAVVNESTQKVTGLKKGNETIDVAASGATNASGLLSGATGYYGNFGAGDSLKAFAVIFDGATLDTASNYIVTGIKEASWTSSTGAKTVTFGSQANATWTPVPEPSTAALALAGLALLLKRRKA